ncbi:MAG: hypothetical protein JWM10_356 [Myxococcaceae bacterium]|nr:hypothetical protein [Myxococcaceae bacterium]
MSARVDLHIDALSFDAGDDPVDGGRVRAVLDEALGQLAERLAGSPLGRSGTRRLALEHLELELTSTDELLGPRGAERLADELYASLSRRLP